MSGAISAPRRLRAQHSVEVAAYHDVLSGIFSTFMPVCRASMM